MLETAFIAVDVTIALLIYLLNLDGSKYYTEFKEYMKSDVVQGRVYKCTGYKMSYNGFGYSYYSECGVTFSINNKYYDMERFPVKSVPDNRIVDVHYKNTSRGIEVVSEVSYYRFKAYMMSTIASCLMVAIAIIVYWL